MPITLKTKNKKCFLPNKVRIRKLILVGLRINFLVKWG